jgi:FlaA1/EpsC-like NDP-sugar epimerase
MKLLQWRWALLDIVAWLVGATVAATVRFDLVPSGVVVVNYLVVGVAAALTQVAVGYIFNLYQGRYRTASFDYFRSISVTTITVAVLVTIPIGAFRPGGYSRTMAFTSGVIVLAIMVTARALHRVNHERSMATLDSAQTVILFGAGEAGEQLAVDAPRPARRLRSNRVTRR